MCKKQLLSLFIFFIVITFIAILPVKNIQAADQLKDITFEDVNMYDAIKTYLTSQSLTFTSNDGTKTITMHMDDINSVTNIVLNVTVTERNTSSSIKGIENFTNLSRLVIKYNDNTSILNINSLGVLTNLEYIEINNITVSDISPLQNCDNLEGLYLRRTRNVHAPISENGFTDISALKDKNKLIYLYISGYDIANPEILSTLTTLTTLDLRGCKIDDNDLKNIKNLTNLITLYLGWVNAEGNDITDITPLKNLVNLETLYLCNNKISDLTPISNLTKLERLYLDQNNVSDLTPISNLINLEYLSTGRENYGKGNPNIKDLSPISNLVNLTSLQLSNSQIEDLSPLTKLSKLRSIDLNGNKVNDFSIFNKELSNVNILDLERQKINITSKTSKVPLPQIIAQSKDPNSKIYAENKYILTNCTFSEDGKFIFVTDITKDATIEINDGKAKNSIVNIKASNLSMSLIVSKDIEEMTNKNVKVTITSNVALKELQGWTLSKNKMSLTKEYEKNDTENIVINSETGETETLEISITNIDKDAPIITKTEKINKDGTITIILTANEKVKLVDGWNLSEDEKVLTKIYKANAQEEIDIFDKVGNPTTVKISVIFKNKTNDNVTKIDNNINKEDVNINNPKTSDNIIYTILVALGAFGALIGSIFCSKKITVKNKNI